MKILIIEDEHKVTNALKRGLEQTSFEVDVAYDSDEGMTKGTKHSYDLVILSRSIPGTHKAEQIVQTMRKAKIHTPVLVLIPKNSARSPLSDLDTIADDFIAKPFALSELMNKIRSLVNLPDKLLSTSVSYKDLTLNVTNYSVTRGSQKIELTNREFTLLEYLMRNPGKVLTKEMITQYVWNYDADILPNTVEVYMGYIRNKTEKPYGKETFIRTRRGFGYIFGEA